MNHLITVDGFVFCVFAILAVLASQRNIKEGYVHVGRVGMLISWIVIFVVISSFVPDFVFGQFLKSTIADAVFITIIAAQFFVRKRVLSSLRNLLSSLRNEDSYTYGQIVGIAVYVVLLFFILLAIDWITTRTGWIVPFFVLSIVLLLHSISMGIGDVIRPIKLKPSNSSLASAFWTWQGPLKVNIINHLLSSVSDGLYFLFAGSLFLKLLYLLCGGFSHATSNYWDWLLFTLYSVIDQICFGLISTLLSILHIPFTSIQATQPLQQWAVYLSTLVFALLFWAAVLKFYKMLTHKGTKKISAHLEDQRLNPSYIIGAIVNTCIVIVIAFIVVLGIEWLVSFTRRAELGLILSALLLGLIIRFTVSLLRTPPNKLLLNPALHGSIRENSWVATSSAIDIALSYLILTAIFFQSLSLLFGGFSHATTNYWDWLSFVFYSAIDQISFNLISIFHLYPGSIQVTQTLQQLTIFLSINLVFTVLFWGSVGRFYWPRISTTLKEQELTEVDIV